MPAATAGYCKHSKRAVQHTAAANEHLQTPNTSRGDCCAQDQLNLPRVNGRHGRGVVAARCATNGSCCEDSSKGLTTCTLADLWLQSLRGLRRLQLLADGEEQQQHKSCCQCFPCLAGCRSQHWRMTVSWTGLVAGPAGPSLPVHTLRGLLLLALLLLKPLSLLALLLLLLLKLPSCWHCRC